MNINISISPYLLGGIIVVIGIILAVLLARKRSKSEGIERYRNVTDSLVLRKEKPKKTKIDEDDSPSMSSSFMNIVMSLVVVAFVLGIGITILSEMSDSLKEEQEDNLYNSSFTAEELSSNVLAGEFEESISSWIPTIGLVLVATITIGIIVKGFRGSGYEEEGDDDDEEDEEEDNSKGIEHYKRIRDKMTLRDE